MNKSATQRGNVLFLILIAVALFAALFYAVTQSSRGGGDADNELAQIAQAESDNCTSSVDATKLRLSLIGGCNEFQISYELPNGSNSNPSAPSDKSCHVFSPGRGDASPCGAWMTEEGCLSTLSSVGDRCGSIVYAGIYGGKRLYTTASNSSDRPWASSASVTGITGGNDGLANTNALLAISGTTFYAAETCRSLGEDWYLPAYNELNHLNSRQLSIGGFVSSASYWSSTENSAASNEHARVINFQGDPVYFTTMIKIFSKKVRCVRGD
jgi:hypothetical protein